MCFICNVIENKAQPLLFKMLLKTDLINYIEFMRIALCGTIAFLSDGDGHLHYLNTLLKITHIACFIVYFVLKPTAKEQMQTEMALDDSLFYV